MARGSTGGSGTFLLVLAGNGTPRPLSPGPPLSCAALVVLLALVMVLSGVLLWLILRRRCIAAAMAAGDGPTRVPPPHPTPQFPPKAHWDVAMGTTTAR